MSIKIGETEIPEAALTEALKANGQRIVKEDDFISKATQGAELAKLRSEIGDLPLTDLANIVKAHKENELKSKSQVELATAAAKELEKQLIAARGETANMKLAMRKRDVDEWFREGQEAFGVKVIEPILAPFKAELYEIKDEEAQNVEFLKSAVKQRLDKAAEIQKGELARLGLAGITQNASEGQSFGGGQVQVKASQGQQITGANDLFSILKGGSANPMNAGIWTKK